MVTQEAAVLSLRKRALRGRRLVVVDIENCVGGAVLTAGPATWVREVVARAVGRMTDQVVIGVSHVGLISTACAWPGARVLVRSGRDGADLVLLDVLQNEGIASRFDEVFLFSGDGIFADTVAALAEAGVRVTVVGHPGQVALQLRLAAAQTRYIGAEQTRIGGAA
ncbi:NYN domain-containing protein [Georgenia faecalis]|uniref:NYN domain-containing protein n=1 Tax=Georgenia faecalis TaxID=2483799 RepID=A0ABV9DBJ6_9MICO|nr:NYN domain-containing protein [Georgenia faecalis]